MSDQSEHNSDGATPSKPNILYLLTDQEQNWTWLDDGAVEFGEAWEGYERMFPNRHQLMRRGLSFKNFYTPTVPCGPARAVIFTGLHTGRNRIFDNPNLSIPTPRGQYFYQDSLPPYDPDNKETMRTIAQWLMMGGYRCAYKGKWHLTRYDQAQELGLEVNEENKTFSLGRYGFEDWQGFDIDGTAGGEGKEYDAHICQDAVEWILSQKSTSQPWFLTVSFVNPHDIAAYPASYYGDLPQYVKSLPPNFADDLSLKPRVHTLWQTLYNTVFGEITTETEWVNLRNAYIQYHRDVDHYMGRVLQALKAKGLDDNTVVVFSADHGELGGAHMLRSKGPELYYESHNVPLTVAAPPAYNWRGGGGEFATTDALACHIDLLPTFCHWAGVDLQAAASDYDDRKAPGLDFTPRGRDLTPILEGGRESVRDAVLFTNDMVQVIPLTWSMDQSDDNIFSRGLLASLDGKLYKYGRYFAPGRQAVGPYEYELYDWSTPDGRMELGNLAGREDYASIQQKLDGMLNELLEGEDARVAPLDPTGKPTPLLEPERAREDPAGGAHLV